MVNGIKEATEKAITEAAKRLGEELGIPAVQTTDSAVQEDLQQERRER